ncbi:MAG: FIST C-terminal domain-containing protein [Desulfovibrio sp.]|jgi:hypothetical protein|nr:FIST C-terminal domain-containing protein [Desulfovibrio sp.]
MIRILTAHTREIDDIAIATAEILEQLDLDGRLLRHSVGILAFHPDFLESGAVRAVSAALPFSTMGGTTSNMAVTGAMGDLMLIVTVLTSDDVTFEAGAVLLENDPRAGIQDLYAQLASRSAEKPSLLLTVAPVMSNIGGDDFIEALDAVSGGVPLFGSLAVSPQTDFGGTATCLNGEHQERLFTLLAVFGNVNPEFYTTVIPADMVIHQGAVITKSEKHLIQSINGLVPLDYLESIGLAANGDILGISSIPFVLTTDDGSAIVRSAYRSTDEGYIMAYGTVPQGARIGFAGCDAQFVLQSARENIGRALAAGGRNALIVACDARRWTLGIRPTAEMREVAECLDNVLPYRIAYAAGELCPVRNHKGELLNKFQNFSTIACRL